MGNTTKDNLGYLGRKFQIRLMAQFLTDRKFANSIMDILNPNYFEDEYLRLIAVTIKDAYEQYETIPDAEILESRLLDTVRDDIQKTYVLGVLKEVKEANLNDSPWVQDKAMKFCKQQDLKKAVHKIQHIIDKGDLDDYDKCEEILRKSLETGDNKDEGISVFDNLDEVLSDDYRSPIPTGVEGLDELMDGGLSKGELGVILAPFGVGKTTMVTKFANTAKNHGYNVLQIFFEDNPKVLQRKHISCWTGIDLNELNANRDEIKEVMKQKEGEEGVLKLRKFASDGTTIPKIRQYIRKQIATGFRPDIVLVDYIDCVQPSKQFDDTWSGEGNVMRQFETMLAELDIAGWTAVQGNRSSIKAEVVEADQMGGSIKKGQIGHFIVSVAKSLVQKEEGRANLAVLKSRFGKDGVVYRDIIFNNANIQIEITEQNQGLSFLETKEVKEKESSQRVAYVLEASQAYKSKQNEGGEDTEDSGDTVVPINN